MNPMNPIKSPSIPPMLPTFHSSHMDIFQNLAVNLEKQVRYRFFNFITNQLRYHEKSEHPSHVAMNEKFVK